MKIFNLVLSLLVISPIANASITLSKPHSNHYEKTIIQEAQHEGLERVELDKAQSFDLIKNGKVLGTLVQGKGWIRDVQPVCFIAWTKDSKKSDQFIQTIGQGDWETVGCHKVDSVGLISKKDVPATKVAVIYTTEAPDHYGNDYYILGLKSGDDSIYYDQSVTEKFQNSYIKNLTELRKAYQK
ncbi:hypothetical protein GC090_08110 [Pantoea sp. JZ29]|uniref:hypothetical protein n=1 Tax=Pantoea sp. JZ29 TaxID=2654192 RepID=UPI002B4838FE|nr:hypothetical protein [Pantoea sp. JZ29]WRH20636.1 hypothetical protein GC090_08110 [Pantoea sp. JZ29]